MDMLVRLYTLPSLRTSLSVRRPLGPEHSALIAWVGDRFTQAWSSEVDAAVCNRPPSVFMAVEAGHLLGFACYDATARGFFGPIGVIEEARNKGIGRALLLACLHDMRTMGYGYAIAGHVGAPDFFRRTVAAIEIPDSTPGIYAEMLKF